MATRRMDFSSFVGKLKGVSTRKVDDLVRALGLDGISRSQVSRICKALD